MYIQHMLLEKTKENYLTSIMSIVFASLKHPILPVSIKIPVTMLKIVYIFYVSHISKFDFMNYLFANLVVAWL